MTKIDWEALTAPFTFDEIHIRPGMVSKKNPKQWKTQPMFYMDPRDVMDRLDRIVGVPNWACRYPPAGNGKTSCLIGIKIDGEWVEKGDGAGDTGTEGDKGAFSDSFKRAAVRWGIGRYLYGIGDAPWVLMEMYESRGEMKANKVRADEMPKLRRFYDQMVGGKTVPNASVSPPDQAVSNKDAREEYERIYRPLTQCNTLEDLKDWDNIFGEAAGALPEDLKESLRGERKRKGEAIRGQAQ
jgi:hypothetical protein